MQMLQVLARGILLVLLSSAIQLTESILADVAPRMSLSEDTVPARVA